ncbi:unnamed protein product [Gongylonema pulchrum]|uniref:Uncharacterized protein n=1 Tax=Gongylonema pulchrum TaxID=637853 RepID=A0A183EPR9_9BILA|nr:unnamed protein product [Gongylonema pulchrum]
MAMKLAPLEWMEKTLIQIAKLTKCQKVNSIGNKIRFANCSILLMSTCFSYPNAEYTCKNFEAILPLRAETIRQNRRLARDEHDWLAAVVERSFFIVFLLMYTFVTVGISAIGFYYWSSVDYITNHYKQ